MFRVFCVKEKKLFVAHNTAIIVRITVTVIREVDFFAEFRLPFSTNDYNLIMYNRVNQQYNKR